MDPAMKELGETPRGLKVMPMNCTPAEREKRVHREYGSKLTIFLDEQRRIFR
jgi:hypothetical protein